MHVWLVVVDHRHGRNIWVSKSEDGAYTILANYCRQWWRDSHGDWEDLPATPPTDDEEVVRDYFTAMGECEWYSIDQEELLP